MQAGKHAPGQHFYINSNCPCNFPCFVEREHYYMHCIIHPPPPAFFRSADVQQEIMGLGAMRVIACACMGKRKSFSVLCPPFSVGIRAVEGQNSSSKVYWLSQRFVSSNSPALILYFRIFCEFFLRKGSRAAWEFFYKVYCDSFL